MIRRFRLLGAMLGISGVLLAALPADRRGRRARPDRPRRTPPGCSPRRPLVMIMLPGLALFYGGLVRRKNVLSTIMHSFFGLALVSVVWGARRVQPGLRAGRQRLGPDRRSRLRRLHERGPPAEHGLRHDDPVPALRGLPADVRGDHAGALTGAFAERSGSGRSSCFTVLWSIFVYSPIAHWVWSADGWLFKARRTRLRRRHRRSTSAPACRP